MGNGGDQLARGAHSAQFEPPKVSQNEWNERVGGEDGFEERLRKKREQEALEQSTPKEAVSEVVEQPALPRRDKYVPGQTIPFRAVQDRIIVARLEAEEKTDGGFFIPEESQEKPQEGLVVAVGPGKYVFGEFIPVSVKPGERVLFGKFAGQEVKVGYQMFLVLREEDIFIVKNAENSN